MTHPHRPVGPVDHWKARMERSPFRDAEVVEPDAPLLDGQHRLIAVIRCRVPESVKRRTHERRRRIVRVATKKYRARRGRR